MVGLTKFGLLASAIFATSSIAAPAASDSHDAMNEFLERFAHPDASYTEADLDEFTKRQGVDEDVKKRQGSYTAVTGVQDGQLGVRQELQTLAGNPDQFNLFLLGLLRMQNTDQSQKLSYYQVAGIHGYPNIPWDNSPYTGSSPGVGYCMHSSILFPVQHRAYMGLFEQVWKQNVNAVVQSFPTSQQQRWSNAANGLRFPYWDWANVPSNANVLPLQVTSATVTVTTPQGAQTITNPLFRYCFHPLNGADMGNQPPWSYWPCTFRYPNRNDTNVQNTYSQNNLAINAMNGQRQNLRDSTYRLFSRCADYTLMSNDANGDSNACQNFGLETIHNIAHYYVGGDPNGNMRYLWYAAFDPVFWLHHMNVERLFAIWQAIHKDSYFNRNWVTGMGTFSLKQGQVVDANTPLAPFHRDTSGNYWTGANIYNHRFFGSTYPEFVGWDGTSASMTKIVNNLYGNGAGSRRKRDASPDAFAGFDISDIIPDVSAADLLTPTGAGKYDWIANAKALKFGMNGPFAVFVFMGKPASEDPTTWTAAENLVGTWPVLAQPGVKSNGQDYVYGSITLTTALVSKIADGSLPDLTPESVTPYLAKNLRWRIKAPDGSGIAANKVPGFKMHVSHASVTPAASDDAFPTYFDFADAINATAGKIGGIGDLAGSLISALNIAHDCD